MLEKIFEISRIWKQDKRLMSIKKSSTKIVEDIFARKAFGGFYFNKSSIFAFKNLLVGDKIEFLSTRGRAKHKKGLTCHL